jgi:hypothetical protein
MDSNHTGYQGYQQKALDQEARRDQNDLKPGHSGTRQYILPETGGRGADTRPGFVALMGGAAEVASYAQDVARRLGDLSGVLLGPGPAEPESGNIEAEGLVGTLGGLQDVALRQLRRALDHLARIEKELA